MRYSKYIERSIRWKHSMEDAMTITGPKVKDFTGSEPTRFPVEVVSAPVFELLMSLFTYASIQDGSLADFAVGPEWFDGIRGQASPDLVEQLDRLEGVGEIWIELAGMALELPHPPTTEALLDHLRSSDPLELRMRLFITGCMHCKSDVDRDLKLSAAAGDVEAINALDAANECRLSDQLRGLLALDPEESISAIIDAIEGFERELFDAAAITPILDRDAEHKRAMAMTMAAPQLVETATNGITFQMQPEVDGIVLIPSIVIRPWVTIGGLGRRRVFWYPVAEQNLTAEPDRPPAHLVDVYKALGDEKRLKLMRILSDGPISLADATERIGLAKSTTHHHLSILRQAGLVLITLGSEKEYSLRRDAIPEAADLLAGFLATTTKE